MNLFRELVIFSYNLIIPIDAVSSKNKYIFFSLKSISLILSPILILYIFCILFFLLILKKNIDLQAKHENTYDFLSILIISEGPIDGVKIFEWFYETI